MNPQLTEILFILDRSGSMESIAPAAIEGFNSFLRKHLEEPGEARVTLVLFDSQHQTLCDRIPIAEMLPLDERSYETRGCTALLDAICHAIDKQGMSLAALAEPQRPGTVIVAILTDGMENASRKHTWQDVQNRIAHQSQTYQWQFLFLGANQDAIATAAQCGIHADHAATFVADVAGTSASMDTFARKSASIRKSRSNVDMTEQEIHDLNAPMKSILKEEDRKKRGQ